MCPELQFLNICRTGDFSAFLNFNIDSINIRFDNDRGFALACMSGSFDIVKGLIAFEEDFGLTDIHTHLDDGLAALYIDQPDMFKFLLTLEPTHGKFNLNILVDYLNKTFDIALLDLLLHRKEVRLSSIDLGLDLDALRNLALGNPQPSIEYWKQFSMKFHQMTILQRYYKLLLDRHLQDQAATNKQMNTMALVLNRRKVSYLLDRAVLGIVGKFLVAKKAAAQRTKDLKLTIKALQYVQCLQADRSFSMNTKRILAEFNTMLGVKDEQ